MAIEESEVAAAAVRPDPAATVPSDPLPRLRLDDLRLRLDSPLFARDPGLGVAVDASSVRELTWRHAVTPVDHTDDVVVGQPEALAEETPAEPPAPTPTVAALPTFESLRLEQPAADIPDRLDASPPESQVDTSPEPTDSDPFDALTSGELALLRARTPEPAPREPDPVLNGLAEMIVRSTPANGLQAVRMTGDVPVIPVEEVAVEHDEPLSSAALEPVQPYSEVEAELNRLAFLPDVEAVDVAGPVDVPPIAVSETVATAAPAAPPAAAVDAGPVLTLAHGDMYAARASAAPVAKRSYADFAPTAYVAPRRKKRHVVRRLFTFLVLLAMVAGGLYAAKIYVLDARWSGDLKPYADTVSEARNLSFDDAVELRTLPMDEYAEALGAWALSTDADSLASTAAELRALGLLNGELDLGAVGLAAMPSSPAFYDHRSKTIVVAAGLEPQLKAFALHRALGLALLDQEYGWGGRAKDASPATRAGIIALYDADALATALGLLSDADREAVVNQIFGLYGTYTIPSSPAPYATVAAGRLGLSAWPVIASLDDAAVAALLAEAAPTDGRVLDVRRLVSGTDVTTGANARGVLYWYHALAARVDDDLAWQAALSWQGDDVTLLNGGTGTCVAAVFRSASDPTGAAGTAFAQWAAAAPAGSATTVTPTAVDGGSQFTISACDPGAGVQTTDGAAVLALGGSPLWSELFRQARVADPALTADVAACIAAQAAGLTLADERGVVDPLGGWTAPAAHPVSRGSC